MNISPLGDKNVMARSKHRWADWRRQRHRYTVDIHWWEIDIKHQIQNFFLYESGEKSARARSSGNLYFACMWYLRETDGPSHDNHESINATNRKFNI
jgi:hypothetical protein